MNRKERKGRQKHFLTMLKKHMKINHKFDDATKEKLINGPSQAIMQEHQRQWMWGITYGNLLMKLDEVGYKFEKHNEKKHKEHLEAAKRIKTKTEGDSKLKVEDLFKL